MPRHQTLATLEETTDLRFGEEADVPALVDLYVRFFDETVYKDFLEIDPPRIGNTIRQGIVTDDRPHIVAIQDGEIVGFIAWILDHTFSVKPVQVLMEIYVVPELRRGPLGRALLGLAILEGKAAGAGAFHAPVASGLDATRTLYNMMRKAGFTDLGYIMRRGF